MLRVAVIRPADAQAIRRKLLLNLVQSDMPGLALEEKKRLLHCVVVGGGPTGVEFSGELSDFIKTDVVRKFSHVKDDIRVTLIEVGIDKILPSFLWIEIQSRRRESNRMLLLPPAICDSDTGRPVSAEGTFRRSDS
jgi:hypothetical protein